MYSINIISHSICSCLFIHNGCVIKLSIMKGRSYFIYSEFFIASFHTKPVIIFSISVIFLYIMSSRFFLYILCSKFDVLYFIFVCFYFVLDCHVCNR